MRKAAVCFALFVAASSASADGSGDRFPVRAGFVPISDGSYHVVILTQDAADATYCAAGWHAGLIQTQVKSANGPIVSNVGCWGSAQASQTDSFRYFDLTAGSVKEFPIDARKMLPMTYEWRTERLFPR
ncbi:hypothetical protein QZN20_09940 [Burkholderia multivorans]|nr:hypothetical protein [Burkholderia multivorans]